MQLTHDKTLHIAVGKHRREMNWKNKKILWSELIQKCSVTHRTAETYAVYVAAKKDRQDEIKDVGGYVGGYLTGGRRKASSVLNRCLLTLDLDFATIDFWQHFKDTFDGIGRNEVAACIYSTHKHSTNTPRYRLLIPLDREVFADEYQAIARKVAGALGIELFDPSTFQPERLMYWPSTSIDGDYFLDYIDAEFLNADAVLKEYVDWTDTSEWPVSEKVDKFVKRSMAKQGDPLEKKGVVGAFCRTYGIHEAIDKYLAEVYEESAVKGRYTYKEGSTGAGLVVYDDKFAYSHHGTDPVSGKLCNAFDLVRLHKFGLMDEGIDEMNRGNRRPSYQAMLEFATKDSEVRKLIGQEKILEAFVDFDEIETEDDEPVSDEWLAGLEVDKSGNYLGNVHNLRLILQNDPRLKGRIAYNEFSRKPAVLKPLPWDIQKFKKTREWNDTDFAILCNYLQSKPYELQITQFKINNILEEIKNLNRVHPVRDYLKSLVWDGQKRLETLMIDYMGAADTDYTRAVTVKTLTAAVARVFEPGCKFDYVLTLIGKEGIGKSSIYRKLGGDWFTDTFNFNMLSNGKQVFEQLQGFWLIEIPEMTGLKKTDMNAAKSFITSRADNYRGSHLKETNTHARQSVFVGTSNNDDFLKADTGNRRFWPLDVDTEKALYSINTDLTAGEIGQIWAEAVEKYKTGEMLYLPPELEKEARRQQEQHTEEHAWQQVIEDYLLKLLPTNWKEKTEAERRQFFMYPDPLEVGIIDRNRVSIKEIWTEALASKMNLITQQAKRDITKIMDNLKGWEKAKAAIRMQDNSVAKGWVKNKQKVCKRMKIDPVTQSK